MSTKNCYRYSYRLHWKLRGFINEECENLKVVVEGLVEILTKRRS